LAPVAPGPGAALAKRDPDAAGRPAADVCADALARIAGPLTAPALPAALARTWIVRGPRGLNAAAEVAVEADSPAAALEAATGPALGSLALDVRVSPLTGAGALEVRRPAVVAWLTREPWRDAGEWPERGTTSSIGPAATPATPAADVCLPIWDLGDGCERYPVCPDCGGRVVWAEAGGVAGSRACVGASADPWPESRGGGCGSTFADSRYHAAAARSRPEPTDRDGGRRGD